MSSAHHASAGPDRIPPLSEFVAHMLVNWRAAAIAFGAVFLPLLLLSAVLTPRYTATATLAVLPSPEFTVRADAGSRDQNASALALDQIMKAEAEIIGSDDLHEAVLRNFSAADIYPDLAQPGGFGPLHLIRWLLTPWLGPPNASAAAHAAIALERFGQALEIHATKDANIIELAFSHKDPQVAAKALQELLATYAQRRSHLYDDPQANIVRAQLDRLTQSSEAADRALATFKASHDIASFEQQRDLLVKRVNDTRQAASDAAAQVAEYTARVETLHAAVRQMPATIGLYREHDADVRLQAIDEGLVDLRGRLAAARVHYREQSRFVTDLKSQLAARIAERKALAADQSPSVQRSGRSPALDQLQLEAARATAERAAAISRRAAIERAAIVLTAELQRLTSYEQELSSLQRAKDLNDDALRAASRVLNERRLVEAAEALRLANVRVIEAPRIPQHPTHFKLLLGLAGVLLATFAALALNVCRYAARPAFFTGEGLAQATGLPVLAVFPIREPQVT